MKALKVVVICALLSFVACQIDESNNQTNFQELKVKRGNFNAFPKLKFPLKDVMERIPQGRFSDTLRNLQIDSTRVTEATKGNITFYTLMVKKLNPEQLYFENLIIVKEHDSLKKAYVAKYYPTQEYQAKLAAGLHAEFEGNAQYIELLNTTSTSVCVTFTFLICNEGGTDHPAGSRCHQYNPENIREESLQICWSYPQYYYIDGIGMGSPTPVSGPPSSNGGGGSGTNTGGSPNQHGSDNNEVITEILPPQLEDNNGNPPSYESFPSVNIEALNETLEDNELALLEIPCNQIQKWQNLSQYVLPGSTLTKIENLQYQNAGAIPNWDVQFLAGANAATVNMDFFPVTITEFPLNPVTGQPFTPQQFYTFFRLNLNSWSESSGVSFAPSEITGQDEGSIWNSTNPLNSIISINMQPDSGSVICSKSSNNHWYFTTISTPWAFNVSQDDYDGLHPVSGNREFGYYQDNSGNYVFYVRGVDRIQRQSAATIASALFPSNPFQKADDLWNNFKQNLAGFVNSNGGSAIINSNEIYRPDWNKVKQVLRGERPISDLGCN